MIWDAFARRPRLSLYIARTFAVQIMLVLTALLAMVLTVDVLGESNTILAQSGGGSGALWTYLILRLPILASQFTPFAVLLAALTTVATLAYTGQVVAMKSSGLSTGEIIGPMMAVGVVCALLHFVTNEGVTAAAAARLDAWRAAGYGAVQTASDTKADDVWVEADATVVHAASALSQANELVLTEITLFHYGDDGGLIGVTQAERGSLSRDGGNLEAVQEFDIGANTVQRSDRQPWPLDITAGDFLRPAVNPDHVGALALYRAIQDFAERGKATAALVAEFHHKFAWPVACVMMPLFAGIAASSLARTASVLLRNGATLLFGFTYFIADSFVMAMARTDALPPALAPWLVVAIFFFVSQSILIRVNR